MIMVMSMMPSGSVGIRVSSSGNASTLYIRGRQLNAGPGELIVGPDTVQPESGWWMFRRGNEIR